MPHSGTRSGLRALAVVSALAIGASSAAAGPSLDIHVLPGETILFDQQSEACDNSHLPDAPARAFRDGAGQTVVFAPNFKNRLFRGPDLLHLTPDCAISFRAAGSDQPEELDDRTWLEGFYTTDGKTVFALASASYIPYRHDMPCPAGDEHTDCWLNGIAALRSTDGGNSFQYVAAPPNHVILQPDFALADTADPPGYITNTNLVSLGGDVYSIVWRRDGERSRNCLIRSPNGDLDRWEVLSGGEFRLIAQLDHGAWRVQEAECDRIGPPGMSAIRGIVQHRPSGVYVAVLQHRRRSPSGELEHGFFYSLSTDLKTWSQPELLLPIALRTDAGPTDSWASYPSLIDDDSPDLNFSTMDDTAYLVFVRFEPESKGWARQLVAVPIALRAD